jgi:hypothetical protein
MAWDLRPSRQRSALVRLVALAGMLLVTLGAATLLAAPTRAAAPDATNQARLDRTIRFLQDVQNADGGFGGAIGEPSDPLFSAWVAIALAAGGVNPRDQKLPGGSDVYSYVTRHAGALSKTTDFERAALVAVAAGTSLHDFGGRDIARTILARQLPSGAFPFDPGGSTGYVNATAFAILPLSTLHEPKVDTALRRGADWLLTAQDPTGAWGYAPGAELSSDTTAGVIEALHAIGRTGTVQEARAWAYLRSLHNADGGFGFSTALPASNSASTSWVVQAMWAAGIDPASYPPDGTGGSSPLDYLASMQQRNGSIRWKAGDDLNSIWMTAYAAPAYGGHPLPVPTIARAVHAVARKTTVVKAPRPRQAASLVGQGGTSPHQGIVIAGGGGRGAALFSRPKPQSQGATPDGVRRAAATRSRPGRADGRGRGAATPRSGSGPAVDSGQSVRGVVIGDPRTADGTPPAAPGLLGAQAGGAGGGPAVTLVLAGLLLLCAGIGAGIERRRPGALG